MTEPHRTEFRITLIGIQISAKLRQELHNAIAEIANQVLDENGSPNVAVHLITTQQGEIPIIRGGEDRPDVPPEIARMLDQLTGEPPEQTELPEFRQLLDGPGQPKDEYGATAGCMCPGCVALRSAVQQQVARWN